MNKACAICGHPADATRIRQTDAWEYACLRCGRFWIHEKLVLDIKSAGSEERNFLSAATRQASEAGAVLQLESDWRDLARTHSNTRFREKADMLMRYLASKTTEFGSIIAFNPSDNYPLVDARTPAECENLVAFLTESGVVKEDKSTISPIPRLSLTMKGWDTVEPIGTGLVKDRSFVAMSFADEFNDAYDRGIRPAIIDDCKLPEPVRMDREQHSENISNRMLAQIRLAEFLVADFSGQRQSVYFEAGFALALGRTVIWTCKKDDFKNTHFDTQQFSHIIWNDPQDLRTKLRDRILSMRSRG